MKFTFTAQELFYVSPAIVLFLFSLVPVLAKVLNKNKEPSWVFNFLAPIFGGVLAAGLSLAAGADLLIEENSSLLIFSDALVIDGVSVGMALLVSLIMCFTVVLAKESPATDKNLFSEYMFLLMNATIGMMIVIWGNDLIVTFVGIEMMSLSIYIMIAISNELKLSKEAAIKYFILGGFASAILIYGISFVYGATGSTYLPEIAKVATASLLTNNYFLIGTTLVLLGFAFKVSLFPFYSWTPDVYNGSSTPLVGFMATGVKLVSFVALLRFISTNFLGHVEAASLVNILQWMAVLTILVGNIAAIKQLELKRMLAYSSVAHSGYLLIGLVAMTSSKGLELGASGVLFYLFSYVIMTLGAVATLNIFEKQADSKVMVDDLRGLAKRSPVLALAFTVLMLSLAGIPPTVGFFGKFYLFSAAVSQGFYWLAIWGVIGSVISVYYYLRPLVVMYMSDEEGAAIQPKRFGTRFTVLLTGILVLVVGLAANPFYTHITRSVDSLF